MESNLSKKQCLILADSMSDAKNPHPDKAKIAALWHIAAQVAELNETIKELSKKIPDKGGLFGMFQ